MSSTSHTFYSDLARTLNAGQSRSVVLHGNIHDLFRLDDSGSVGGKGPGYVTLLEYLTRKCRVPGLMVLVYELNGPIRFCDPADRDRLRKAWIGWKSGQLADDLLFHGVRDGSAKARYDILGAEFDRQMTEAVGQPTMALEMLRQLTLCSRSESDRGQPFLREDLLIFIEASDLLLPAGDGDIARMNATDRHRVAIVQDWFSDPGFMTGEDAVVLLADSRSLIHPRIIGLPQVLAIETDAPDTAARASYIEWATSDDGEPLCRGKQQLVGDAQQLAAMTAGLSLQALRQLLIGAAHAGKAITAQDAAAGVERYIQQQLGEDVIEFKKPTHQLDDVIGFTQLKGFLREELIPRVRATGPEALPGAAVAGAIGSGKTFIFEAVAAELDAPVLVLKNIRSQWYGQTDVIFEKLRRVLASLGKVVLFVDEADTQFGGVGEESQATERRLTGKIQAMMSDPALRGQVVWLLMTARIHLLSPDIRRPGRVGDLIIPVLDPEGDDRRAFVKWAVAPAVDGTVDDDTIDAVHRLTDSYSAAGFASLRSTLKAKAILKGSALTLAEVERIVHDQIPAAIGQTRRYQTLQALVNCTRRSLLPDPSVSDEEREAWQGEIRELEARGVK